MEINQEALILLADFLVLIRLEFQVFSRLPEFTEIIELSPTL